MRRVSQRLLGKTGKRGGTPSEVCPSGSRQCDWEALSTVSEAHLFARQELSLETVPFSPCYTIEDATLSTGRSPNPWNGVFRG